MREDAELLRRYVDFHSEADFTELVRRHLGFVYHAALRRTGGRADLAEEISQQVFTTLARRAAVLCDHPVLAGWLHTTTRNAANTVLRTERRRAARELEAQRMSDLDKADGAAEWPRVREELDRVLDELPERDREAILLRFFHNKPFAHIGASLSLNEDAARKRVDRALERLHGLLAKRGVTSTAAALATMLAGQSALAAPAGLTQSVASTALLNATTGGVSVGGLLSFMSTKTTIGVAGLLGLAGLLTLPPVGIAIYETREARHAEAALLDARREQTEAAARLQKLRANIAGIDQRAAETQAVLEQARRTAAAAESAAASKPAPPVDKATDAAREDARTFFARFGEAKPMLIEIGRAQIRRNYGDFYRYGNLNPAQIEAIESKTAEYWYQNAALTPSSLVPTVGDLPEPQLRAILGDEGYDRMQEFRRLRLAYDGAKQLAIAVGYSAVPMTDEQGEKITQAIIRNGSSPGGKVTLDGLDWDAVISEVKTTLTPEQFKAGEPQLLALQFRYALIRAHQGAVAAAKSKP